jgi:RNA polymerase sigma factor (sigma-70 family)
MRAVSIPARAPAVPLRSRRLLALAGDKRLVEQVRRGNEAAFEVIFERHGPAILAFCRHMLGTREEAEDAVQHSFTAAYRDLQRGGDREIALKPWLFTIARHRCLSLLRMRREVPTAIEVLESGSSSGAGLADQVEERAEVRRLLADIRELPEEQRAALLLTELGDLSQAEAAGVLGCEVSRVKGLVFRARSALIARREAREAPCESIREQLANLRGGSLRRSELRLHLRECPGCRAYREQVRQQRRMLAVALPVAPTLGLKSSVLAAIGIGGGSAGGLTAAAGGLGGATVAKVAVAGALAGGGVVAGTAVVESDRPAAPTPPATQRVDQGEPPRGAPGLAGRGASRNVDRGRPDAAGRGAQVGRRALAGGAPAPKAERAEELTKRAGAKTAPGQTPGPVGQGRGPIDHATKVTPVKRGPPAKPWKAERGAKTVPRGQAKGHAKGAPGPKAKTKPGPRANGHSKRAGSPTGSVKGSPKGAPDARPAPGAKSKAGAKPNPGVKPKVKGPAAKSKPGVKKPKVKAPARGVDRLAQPPKVPKPKAGAISPVADKPAPAGKTP